MRWAVVAVALLACGCTTQDTTNPPVFNAPPVTAVSTTTTTQVQAEARVREAPSSTPVSAAPTTSTVPPVTTTLPEGLCPQWLGDAVAIGWPISEIETVDYLIHRESRCDPTVINTSDPRGGSRGLMQINGHWCRPNPSYGIDVGWLQEFGILNKCDDLYDPHVNLQAALVIWLEYGYEPWGM